MHFIHKTKACPIASSTETTLIITSCVSGMDHSNFSRIRDSVLRNVKVIINRITKKLISLISPAKPVT